MNVDNQNKEYEIILSIAGSDCSGGAGIQADIKTITTLGSYAATVITALTAQNSIGVDNILPISTSFILDQWNSIISDLKINAIKIGMLTDLDLISKLSLEFKKLNSKSEKLIPIILDPVMVATSGDLLVSENVPSAFKEFLFKNIYLLTPNLYEAEVLINHKFLFPQDAYEVCRELFNLGAPNVLLKGGHYQDSIDPDKTRDALYLGSYDKLIWIEGPRYYTQNTHGTGCTLSAAIATYLAKGLDVESSVRKAKTYLSSAIYSGSFFKFGRGEGHGPVHHFFNQL